ncbi:MAG: 4Fe-4S dicluster domain-containing protein, partial [Candidatus Hodarchaeales archaeon]
MKNTPETPEKKASVRLMRRMVSFVLQDIRKIVPENTPLIEPAPESSVGLTVPEVVAIHGPKGRGLFKLILMVPYVLKTMRYARKSSRSITKKPHDAKNLADKEFFDELEAYAKDMGCTAIGYTEVPRDYIFQNKPLLFKNAIILTMDMKKKKLKKAPSIATGKEVWQTYAGLSKVVYKLSEFMRKRGFNAHPDPPIGGRSNFVLLAQKAGLGHIGRHGLLISEKNGPSQRIAAIYTDIANLPFTDSNAENYSWIPEFCDTCNHCVKACP